MKKFCMLMAVAAMLFAVSQLYGQCTGNRYQSLVFPGNPTVTSDVVYGSNTNWQGTTVQLKMDIYRPACDTATKRPLIVFAHGGSFVSGDKADATYVATATQLAKLGYVVASINYRLGFPQSGVDALYGFNSAIVRAVHDARASIRWLRDNAINGGNTYGIDVNKVFFGGVSAGGIMALHLAYQNQQSELTMNCNNQPGTNQSSIEGLSNNLTTSSAVNAIISISGGIRDLNWITTNDIPVCMAHGTVDGTVPYGNGQFGGYFPVSGSSTIAQRCATTGTKYCFTPMINQDHTPTNPAYADTISVLMRNFLQHFMCGGTLNCAYNGTPTTLTPAVSIAVTSGSSTICTGQSVTFTATVTNGGTNVSYQWKKGSTNVGTNSPTYTSSSLANGDVITCVLTTCASLTTTTSNAVTMTVTSASPAGVSIALTAGTNPSCTGQSLTFTATPTNGGNSPTYQWKKNGGNVGTNSATYTSNILANNDIITCSITSNSSCANPTGATSTGITVSVTSTVAPTVSIAGNNTICTGQSVTFTATPGNGGIAPTYQWKKNGGNVGTNSSMYSTNGLANGDVINCSMTSNLGCASPAGATSNSITMAVSATQVPAVSIAVTGGTNPTCANQTVTLTATPVNGGNSPDYQWKISGVDAGTNSSTFTPVFLSTGDVITCSMTSNSSCANPTTAVSNGVTITVNPVPVITKAGNVLTSTAATGNQWYRNGQLITGAIIQTYTATTSGTYTVQVAGCESEPVTVTITGVEDLQADKLKVFPNPAVNGFNVAFSSFGLYTYTLQVLNVSGAVVWREEFTPSGDYIKHINSSAWAKGTYLVKLSANGSEWKTAVLVQ